MPLIEVYRSSTNQTYDEASIYFTEDYDRANPVTAEKALEEWV